MGLERRDFDVMERLKGMVEDYEARTGRDFWSDLRDELLMSDMPWHFHDFFVELLGDRENGKGGSYA